MLAPNSPPAILERIQSGRIGWAGPLAMTTARTHSEGLKATRLEGRQEELLAVSSRGLSRSFNRAKLLTIPAAAAIHNARLYEWAQIYAKEGKMPLENVDAAKSVLGEAQGPLPPH